MSGEKTNEVVGETHHGISVDREHDPHYPVVAEGTGKTLDTAAGATAREVHNVSLQAVLPSPWFPNYQMHVNKNPKTIGRVVRRYFRVQD